MSPRSSYRKNTHNSKKNTDSIPAKKTPPVTPNTKPHDEDTIKSLTARIDMLEKRVLELEGVLEVTRKANSLLKREVDNLQQYQRRACIIADGITPVKDEKDETEEQITEKTKNFLIKNLGFEERKVNDELNKCYCLGKAKDGKQSTIIRFKSHSFRTSVYATRSKIQNKKKLKVKLSLTKRRAKIINYTHIITDPVPEVKFAYADVNSNLSNLLAGLYQTVMYLMMKMFNLEVVRNTFLFIYNIIFSFFLVN